MKLGNKEIELLKSLIDDEIVRNEEEPIGGWQRKLRLKNLSRKINDAWSIVAIGVGLN